MTPYAKTLLAYVRSNMPKGTDCEAWLDSNIQGWRTREDDPPACVMIVEDDGEEE